MSRYHIEVVYKPSKDNTVANGLSQWAYPAGLADDTNFRGSEADATGFLKEEPELKEREEAVLAQRARDFERLNVATAMGPALTFQLLASRLSRP